MAEIASGRCIFTTSPCVQEILNWETSFEAYPKERGLSVDDGRVTEGWGGLWG